MPTIDFLKKQFPHGYDSGVIHSLLPCRRRRHQEKAIGGSYRGIYKKAIRPYLKEDSVALELGPGAGSWTRAILKCIPRGKLYTLDFQDAAKWLRPDKYRERLECHQVEDNSFSCIDNDSIDYFWSFGVLCHNNVEHIEEIFANALPKMNPGGISCHQYGDWEKLEAFGWERTNIPLEFKNKPDSKIWWPRNSGPVMKRIAEKTGWSVLSTDLNLVKRDAIILLQRRR